MRRLLFQSSLIFFTATSLFSHVNPFSEDFLNAFYEEYICNQKNVTFEAGLTSPCTNIPGGGTGGGGIPNFVPPPNPAPPPINPTGGEELPLVIVNNTGAPDSEVFLVITGKDKDDGNKLAFVEFAPNGVGSLVLADPVFDAGNSGEQFTLALSEMPVSPGGHVVYLPYTLSGAIWFSIHDKLALPAVVDPSQPGGVGILQPNPTDETDVNYRTLWDFYEIDYEELPVPVIFADATAVTQFNLPLYGFLSTPDSTSGFNSGLFQPRRFILEQAQARFNAQPLSSEWNKLFILGQPSFSDSNITRLVSTGKGIAAGAGSPALFDKDYLDNKSTYGFSFIEDIWSGTTSFYRTNTLFIKVPDTVGSSELYTGLIELDNSITFTSTPSGHIVLFPAPTGPAAVPKDTTTFLIFSGLPLFSSETFPDDGTQLSKLFGEAIIPGFVPSTEVISDPNVEATKPIFYTNNPNLNDNPNVTGAWYDVYSGALHALGNIYTYAFDDAKALWPEVQIFATDTNVHPNDPNDPTYMGITLGPLTY